MNKLQPVAPTLGQASPLARFNSGQAYLELLNDTIKATYNAYITNNLPILTRYLHVWYISISARVHEKEFEHFVGDAIKNKQFLKALELLDQKSHALGLRMPDKQGFGDE